MSRITEVITASDRKNFSIGFRALGIQNKVQVNLYAAGLHREGSKAVKRYTMMELKDRFALMCVAFGAEQYKVDWSCWLMGF